ncbi:MAG: translation initiation factor 2, partial [Stackebrandtia sp.]
SGPPRTDPPPKGWMVPEVIVPAPPRELPSQNHAAVDAAERHARTITQGMAILAGSLMFVVLIVVLVR